MRTSAFILAFILLLLPRHSLAWSNHGLISRDLVANMPQIAGAPQVKVESLDTFLLKNEAQLEVFFAEQESWFAKHAWHHAPLPSELAFKATGNAEDIRQRFAHALRINPHNKWALYLQLLPGETREPLPRIAPEKVSTLNNHYHLPHLYLIQLREGDNVDPAEVISSANDEPDHGMDIGLFSDNHTDYGKRYGFGTQPFGNPNLEYSSQAPFHIGYYHESSLIFSSGEFLTRTFADFRIAQFKQLAEFAFKNGHDYWGYRFMGIGMHYIGDFSQPYHTTPAPGFSDWEMIFASILTSMGLPQTQTDIVQLMSNRHSVLEDFQSLVMETAYSNGDTDHVAIKALSPPVNIRDYSDSDPIDIHARQSWAKANPLDKTLLEVLPPEYVDDPSIEYSDLKAKPLLYDIIREYSGETGVARFEATIADLLKDFSRNGASYVSSILEHRQN